jgi:hypothetical protein
MSKHYAPRASSYSDASYIERCVAAFVVGGNWENMVQLLNHSDMAEFNRRTNHQAIVKVVKLQMNNAAAHNVLARMLGES